MSCSKTAELIEMPFGGPTLLVQGTMYIRWDTDSPREGVLSRGYMPAIVTYVCMSALRSKYRNRLPPRANVHACPAHAADECVRRRAGCQYGDAAFCLITFDTCQIWRRPRLSVFFYIGEWLCCCCSSHLSAITDGVGDIKQLARRALG